MELKELEKDRRKNIFFGIKNIFKEKLGKYTHQRISDEWHFYGLGFVRDEMTYVFGFNIGFFKKEVLPTLDYSHVGMNVLVRTNGINPELRQMYSDFFSSNLKNWILQDPQEYSSFRGGAGLEFARLKKISDFANNEEIILFLEECMLKLQRIYPFIMENPDGIFSHVVRAAPPWHDTLLQLAIDQTKELTKSL